MTPLISVLRGRKATLAEQEFLKVSKELCLPESPLGANIVATHDDSPKFSADRCRNDRDVFRARPGEYSTAHSYGSGVQHVARKSIDPAALSACEGLWF